MMKKNTIVLLFMLCLSAMINASKHKKRYESPWVEEFKTAKAQRQFFLALKAKQISKKISTNESKLDLLIL